MHHLVWQQSHRATAAYPCVELLVSGEVDMCQATWTPALLLLSGVNRVRMITLAGLQETQWQLFRHFETALQLCLTTKMLGFKAKQPGPYLTHGMR